MQCVQAVAKAFFNALQVLYDFVDVPESQTAADSEMEGGENVMEVGHELGEEDGSSQA